MVANWCQGVIMTDYLNLLLYQYAALSEECTDELEMEDIDDPKKLQGATKIGVTLDYVRIEFVMKWGHVNT